MATNGSNSAPDSGQILSIRRIIGYNGAVRKGFVFHPDGFHVVFPLGCNVMVENINTKEQDILTGHTDVVSCVACSPSGKLLASGQSIHMGFKAEIIIWDFAMRQKRGDPLVLHKVNVQDLAFSPNEIYLASLGGQDDSSIFVWDVVKLQPICGNSAQVKSAGAAYCIEFSQKYDNKFVTGGEGTLRVWDLDVVNRKVTPTDVNMGGLGRTVNCIQMADAKSEYFFCGTTSGDIVGININSRIFQIVDPVKEKFKQGVISLAMVNDNPLQLYVGAGDGEVAVLELYKKEDKNSKAKKIIMGFSKKASWKDKRCNKAITSIAPRQKGHQIYFGTANSQLYSFMAADFVAKGGSPDKGVKLVRTYHSSGLTDVVFPSKCDQLIVTSQMEEIRIWELVTNQEVTRLTVPNMTCNAVAITSMGDLIVSAWSDGKIRGFTFKMNPSTLKQEFCIDHAHSKEVTAIALKEDNITGNLQIVSGGGEGQVRLWSVSPDFKHTTLIAQMKEHKGRVTDIKIEFKGQSCVSASTDGSCIVWDLEKYTRSQIVFSNTLFQAVCFGKEGSQIITGGTDRKIGYFGIGDGEIIRELDGSKSGSINAIDISADGNFIATGGDDKQIKIWTYDDGALVAIGEGHSSRIVRVRISSSQRPEIVTVVSVSQDGAIIIWDFKPELIY